MKNVVREVKQGQLLMIGELKKRQVRTGLINVEFS